MDTSWAKTTLDNLKSSAGSENNVGRRHADVGESDVGMAVGGIVETEDRQHSVDLDTRKTSWDYND